MYLTTNQQLTKISFSNLRLGCRKQRIKISTLLKFGGNEHEILIMEIILAMFPSISIFTILNDKLVIKLDQKYVQDVPFDPVGLVVATQSKTRIVKKFD